MADSAVLRDEQSFTYADYRAWDLKEGERYELIDGVPYAMSAPGAHHQEILIALAAAFYGFFKGKPCKVYPAPYDVRLFYRGDEADDTVVQPDLAVVCDEEKRGPEGCRGAPDLVIEILSPSNTVVEMMRKFDLYRRAAVQEYWLVSPEEKSIHAYCFLGDRVVGRVYTDAAEAEIFPGLKLSLEEIFAE
ncbi:MAG: Uma2 family endonuclease [Treponema sp.]|jgi:Uma2 family endonuclease|nr:Uma2 family endonuclease [Treponema sp.]